MTNLQEVYRLGDIHWSTSTDRNRWNKIFYFEGPLLFHGNPTVEDVRDALAHGVGLNQYNQETADRIVAMLEHFLSCPSEDGIHHSGHPRYVMALGQGDTGGVPWDTMFSYDVDLPDADPSFVYKGKEITRYYFSIHRRGFVYPTTPLPYPFKEP